MRRLCNRRWRPDLVLLQCMGDHAQRSRWAQVGMPAAFSLEIIWKACLWAVGTIPECTEMYPKGYCMLLWRVGETLLLSGSPMTILSQGYWSTLSFSAPKFWLHMGARVAAVKKALTVFINYFLYIKSFSPSRSNHWSNFNQTRDLGNRGELFPSFLEGWNIAASMLLACTCRSGTLFEC